MASKSKKRRRVLGASCILAALIIAGSSFAWFTSKDEVTNRLTANSDYGVSIVESFTPPKNWIPGQEINKDVYAVNTGSIAAFVKESISGNLTYTYEKRTGVAPDESGKPEEYVELDKNIVRAIDGATSQEAGGFLAWTNAKTPVVAKSYKVGDVEYQTGAESQGYDGTNTVTFVALTPKSSTGDTYYIKKSDLKTDGAALYSDVGTVPQEADDGVAAASANKTVAIETEGGDASITPGPVNSATLTDLAESNDDDNTTEVHGTVTSRWHPTETGIYIFRRSYVPAVKDNPDTPENETKAGYYTYAGYYYVASNTPNNPNTPEDESEGKYYKIVIGDDKFRANNDAEVAADTTGETNFVFDVSADQSVLGNAVEVKEDGSLEGAVRYQYVKEVKVENVTPTLTYHGETTDKPAYLTATYSDESTEEGADAASKQAAYEQAKAEADAARQNYLDKLGDAAATEVDYENALGAYNTAMSRYKQAKADWDYAKALSDASKALIDAAETRATAEKKKDDALAALKAAYKAVTGEATTLSEDGRSGTTAAGSDAAKFGDLLVGGLGTEDKNDISYVDIFNTDRTYNTNQTGQLEAKINALLATSVGNAANKDELTKAQEYMGKMKTLWDNSSTGVDATDASIVGASKRLDDAIKALTAAKFSYDSATDSAKYVEDAMKEVYAARQKLEDNLKDYKALYQKLELAVGTEPQLTELLSTGDNSTSFGDKIDAWITRIGNLKTRLEDLNDDANIGKKVYTAANIAGGADYGEDARVQDYIIKYNNYVDELANVEDAKADWKTAVETYNKAVSKGLTDYVAAIETNQQKNDINGHLAKNDFEGLDKATDNSKWYLTNNNDALVGLYAVDRDATKVASTTDARDTTKTIEFKGADGTSGENDKFADPQITYAENGWQTIGSASKDIPTSINSANYSFYGTTTTVTNTSAASYTAASYDAGTGVVTNGSYTKAVIAVNTAETAFKTLVTNSHANANPTNETVDNLYKAVTDTGDSDLLTKKNKAEQAYKDAVKAATTAEEASTKAAGRASNALATAGTAAADDESRIEIIINLAEEASKLDWTSALGNHESAQVADFYYNYILEAGETSSKLIDSVQLSPSVGTSDYKTLEFDLNVALDSAQITYADDQRTITSTAVDSNDAFKKNVKTIDQETLAVEWEPNEASASADTKYRVGLNVVEPKTYEGAKKEKGDVELPYTFKIGADDYYGEEVKDGATFYKWDATNAAWAADDTAVKLIEIK